MNKDFVLLFNVKDILSRVLLGSGMINLPEWDTAQSNKGPKYHSEKDLLIKKKIPIELLNGRIIVSSERAVISG